MSPRRGQKRADLFSLVGSLAGVTHKSSKSESEGESLIVNEQHDVGRDHMFEGEERYDLSNYLEDVDEGSSRAKMSQEPEGNLTSCVKGLVAVANNVSPECCWTLLPPIWNVFTRPNPNVVQDEESVGVDQRDLSGWNGMRLGRGRSRRWRSQSIAARMPVPSRHPWCPARYFTAAPLR